MHLAGWTWHVRGIRKGGSTNKFPVLPLGRLLPDTNEGFSRSRHAHSEEMPDTRCVKIIDRAKPPSYDQPQAGSSAK